MFKLYYELKYKWANLLIKLAANQLAATIITYNNPASQQFSCPLSGPLGIDNSTLNTVAETNEKQRETEKNMK